MRGITRALLCALVLTAPFAPLPASAQAPAPAPTAPAPAPQKPLYKPEELDQMLAPIALYPDSLLAQVLMAATYPLEVVEASRWSKANPNLKGDAAVQAVQDKTWDVSVKSLAAFPQVLATMNDKLDWTQKLGDAMLSQEKDVAASIQRLRKLSYDAGRLKTGDQQKVTVQPAPAQTPSAPQTIVIEPASPQAIYVPAYEPSWAYGSWPYPAYPPYSYPPPVGYGYGAPLLTGFMWGVGAAAAGAMFSSWNWGGGDVNVNVNRAAYVDRNFNGNRYQNGKWSHQPDHRRGVAYRDAGSRSRYGASVPGADGRRDFRGKDIAGRPGGPGAVGQRPGGPGGIGQGQRPGGVGQGQRPGGVGQGQRPGGVGQGQRPGGVGQGQRPAARQSPQGGAFGGIDRGGQRVNRDAARGRASGGYRGGGGARGGGGRGGGGRGGGGRR
ncbi:DUF3300 domain-containing protein [Vineibacter terrae]|uniref:DUF3300 domain-containing protein n=1 Tax=Vineibacter terrae TaxID=2586908 RepID=A0A5C8P8F5_9HYPH|nr:DUF3300 domain-containing protein [Vineibacter terrae]TXL70052.1 DUF3300 domain-containing protein [Vineibacter terrae]